MDALHDGVMRVGGTLLTGAGPQLLFASATPRGTKITAKSCCES